MAVESALSDQRSLHSLRSLRRQLGNRRQTPPHRADDSGPPGVARSGVLRTREPLPPNGGPGQARAGPAARVRVALACPLHAVRRPADAPLLGARAAVGLVGPDAIQLPARAYAARLVRLIAALLLLHSHRDVGAVWGMRRDSIAPSTQACLQKIDCLCRAPSFA